MSPAAVIGLDGAAWHLLEPLIDHGHMPRLAALRDAGAWGTLASTVPTYTPPAWTSAVTGVNPGRHGVYGFIEGNAQSERQDLMHSGKIRSAPIWKMANAQGKRIGVYNVPLTFPPQQVQGWMVSGMLTPGYGERQRGFATWDGQGGGAALEARILQWAPDYVLDVNANYEQDWRDDTLCKTALRSLEQRYRVLEGLLDMDPPDVLFTVLEGPDRLQHVYYRYMDPADPLYETPEAQAIRPSIEQCFAAMDRIVGLLADYATAGAVVCSDHGFTAWEVSVHTNALLESWGLLHLKGSARAMQSGVARGLVPIAKRFLPRKVARQAKGRTFSAIDWTRTKAFASPIPQQGVFVNLEGREPQGIVSGSDLSSVKDEIVARFQALSDPSGKKVTDRVYRSEDVFHGDALAGAPDVLPVLRDHRYELDDEVFHRDAFTDLRHLPRGVHHLNGIVIVAGPPTQTGRSISGSVMDVTPTLLYLAHLDVPDGLDGKVIEDAFDPHALKDRPVVTTAPLSSEAGEEASPYSAEEEAMIEESLRGLGYL
ncbi:MAG: alkaline phosphatase family protein [Actinomycetota bacterium]